MSQLTGHRCDAGTDTAGAEELVKAAKTNDLTTVTNLLGRGLSPDVVDPHGNAALHQACTAGHVGIVEALLDAGANIELPLAKVDGKRAVHCAASAGHVSVLNTLAKRGADLQASDERGLTALHYASRDGHVLSVHYLVTKGLPIDVEDSEKHTPLHWAAYSGLSGYLSPFAGAVSGWCGN